VNYKKIIDCFSAKTDKNGLIDKTSPMESVKENMTTSLSNESGGIGKNWHVKMCSNDEVSIVGEAFVLSVKSMSNVEGQNVSVISSPKKITKKGLKKDVQVSHKSEIKVHMITRVPSQDEVNNSKKSLSLAMHNKIFKWSQSMFHRRFWTTHEIRKFEVLSNFLYDTVKEDEIDYPSRLTWIDNVIHGNDEDLYATRLLFVLNLLQACL